MYHPRKFSLCAPGILALVMSFSTFVAANAMPNSVPQAVPTMNKGGAPYQNVGPQYSMNKLGDRTNYDKITLTEESAYNSSDTDVEKEFTQFTSEDADTPALKVASGGSLTATGSSFIKSGDTDDRENSGFYGFNVGVLASSSTEEKSYVGSGESTSLSLSDCTISTDAVGANGAFAFGEDAVVNLDHVTIKTTGDDNSRGIDATYGGTVNITNSVISTEGDSCAAMATDRYQEYNAPMINADNCVGTTAGSGSPGLYCTGTFNVSNSTLTATGSEAAAIEGYNSINLYNTSITGAEKWGVIIYQSMSGDSSEGEGSFSMTGGSLTNNSDGPLFFVCDTTAVIRLSGAKLVNPNSDVLLWATTAAAGAEVNDNVNTSWGSLGGTVTFTATDQVMAGDIDIQEDTSSINLKMFHTQYSGAINPDDAGTAVVTLDKTSTWNVTGTSYLTMLSNNGTLTGPGTVYVNGTQYYP